MRMVFVHLLQTVTDEFIFYISTFGKYNNLLNAVFREQTPYKNMITESKIIFKSQNVTKVPKWRFKTEIWIKWLCNFKPRFIFRAVLLVKDNCHGDFYHPWNVGQKFCLPLLVLGGITVSPGPASTVLLWRCCWLTGARERGGVSHRWTIVIITFIVTLRCFITEVFKDGTHCSKIRLVLSWEVTTFGQFYFLSCHVFMSVRMNK